MIADGIANLVIWIIQHTLLKLPVNLPFVSFTFFEDSLVNISAVISSFLVILDKIVNINVVIWVIMGIIAFELLLFGLRIANWGTNLLRGSGAKI